MMSMIHSEQGILPKSITMHNVTTVASEAGAARDKRMKWKRDIFPFEFKLLSHFIHSRCLMWCQVPYDIDLHLLEGIEWESVIE